MLISTAQLLSSHVNKHRAVGEFDLMLIRTMQLPVKMLLHPVDRRPLTVSKLQRATSPVRHAADSSEGTLQPVKLYSKSSTI